jgi:hypothetical protein
MREPVIVDMLFGSVDLIFIMLDSDVETSTPMTMTFVTKIKSVGLPENTYLLLRDNLLGLSKHS